MSRFFIIGFNNYADIYLYYIKYFHAMARTLSCHLFNAANVIGKKYCPQDVARLGRTPF